MRHLVKQVPDYERVRKFSEYHDFIFWCAIPEHLRKPATQGEFAKEKSMHESQLSRWKAMPEFRKDLVEKVTELMSHKISNVMYALENRIYKDGNASEVRLFLEWVIKWMPEIKLNLEGRGRLDEEQAASLIKQVALEFEKKLAEGLSKKKDA